MEGDLNIALLQSKEHFDTLVSGVQDYAIFLLNPEGNVISWNAGAQRIKGYNAEEIVGKNFSVFYTQEALERDCPRHTLRIAARDGRCTDEGWRIRKDGSRFWANVVVTALRTENSKLLGFLKITRDLTQRRQIEALQQADHQKDEFLATLFHELRTQLNAVSGWIYLMRESRNSDAIMSQGLDVLQRSTDILIRLTSDLLDISKISSGKTTLDFEELDLRKVVDLSVKAFATQAVEKSISLETSVEVPKEVDCKVWGDETRLYQILANLLSNALKFTPEGGSVSIQLKQAQAKAIVVVKDTGKGISPEFLPHIFERFAQEISEEHRGLGLGLAICKHLVKLHGGSISAESEGLGRGTMIKVELPVIAPNEAPRTEHTITDGFQ
jgi:PAS domain S-box-containing protein